MAALESDFTKVQALVEEAVRHLSARPGSGSTVRVLYMHRGADGCVPILDPLHPFRTIQAPTSVEYAPVLQSSDDGTS